MLINPGKIHRISHLPSRYYYLSRHNHSVEPNSSSILKSSFLSSNDSTAHLKTSKLKITCEYDGKGYSGWSKSPSNKKPSIQEQIEVAWMKLFPETKMLDVRASSRTDAGVHALEQVITIESDILFSGSQDAVTDGSTSIPANSLYKTINGYLPDDIVFKSSIDVPLSFICRRKSLRRKYKYDIYNHPIRSALLRNNSWHVKYPLDIPKMSEAAQILEGRHNMACFCPVKFQPKDPEDCFKTIFTSRIVVNNHQPNLLSYEVVGSSFLYRQVRNTVGALVAVGAGKMTLSEFQGHLAGGVRSPMPGAPAKGLTLLWVEHDMS